MNRGLWIFGSLLIKKIFKKKLKRWALGLDDKKAFAQISLKFFRKRQSPKVEGIFDFVHLNPWPDVCITAETQMYITAETQMYITAKTWCMYHSWDTDVHHSGNMMYVSQRRPYFVIKPISIWKAGTQNLNTIFVHLSQSFYLKSKSAYNNTCVVKFVYYLKLEATHIFFCLCHICIHACVFIRIYIHGYISEDGLWKCLCNIYIYIYTHTHTHTYVHTYIDMYHRWQDMKGEMTGVFWAHIHANARKNDRLTYIHKCNMHAHKQLTCSVVYQNQRPRPATCMCHIHMHTYTQTHTHVCIHINMCVYMCVNVCIHT